MEDSVVVSARESWDCRFVLFEARFAGACFLSTSLFTARRPNHSFNSYHHHQPNLPFVSLPLPLFTHTTQHTLTSTLLPLRTPTPNALHQPIPLRQPIQTVVSFPHRPHEPAQCVHLVLARVPAVFVHFADGNLHGGVVFGFYDAVGCGAFAGDVAGG